VSRDRAAGARWQVRQAEHGQWLDLGAYAEAVSGFILDLLSQGRTREAARWWEAAERRLASSPGERTALYLGPMLLAAATGRHPDAVAHQRHIDTELFAGPVAPGLRSTRTAGQIYALTEQAEIGPPFDEAVATFEEICLPPAVTPRGYRVTFFQIALGRTAQYGGARLAASRCWPFRPRSCSQRRRHRLFTAYE